MQRRANGLWCDVAYDAQGRLCFVYSVAGAVVCERDGAVLWRTSVGTDFLRYLRIGVEGDHVYACGQSANDHAILVGADGAHDLGPGVDQNPVAFGTVDGALAVWVIYAEGVRYRVLRVRDAVVLPGGGSAPKTSQGIRDIGADASIVWGDPTYGGTFAGRQFNQFQRTSEYIVGQRSDPDGIGCLVGGSYWTAMTTRGAPLGVHGAIHGSRLAVCAYGDGIVDGQVETGAWIGLFDSPYPVDAPTQPPAPPVQPPPQPTEPKPMPFANHLDTLQAVRAKYPPLVTADQAVAILNEVAFIHRDEGLGLLRKESGNHGAQPTTGILCSVDWLVNSQTGTGLDTGRDGPDGTTGTPGVDAPQWGDATPFDTSKFVPPVEPQGATIPNPQPPAPPTPPSSASGVTVDQMHAAIAAAVAAARDELSQRIDQVDAKPAAIPHGATVTVKVKGHIPALSIRTVEHGTDVEWTGTGAVD